jgi:hypothetical protein
MLLLHANSKLRKEEKEEKLFKKQLYYCGGVKWCWEHIRPRYTVGLEWSVHSKLGNPYKPVNKPVNTLSIAS